MSKRNLKQIMQSDGIDIGDIVLVTNNDDSYIVGYIFNAIRDDSWRLCLSHQDPLERFNEDHEREWFLVSFESNKSYELLKKRSKEERNKGLSLRQPTLLEYKLNQEGNLTLDGVELVVFDHDYGCTEEQMKKYMKEAKERRVLGKVRKGLGIIRIGHKTFSPSKMVHNICDDKGIPDLRDIKLKEIEQELRRQIPFATYDTRNFQYADSFAITERNKADHSLRITNEPIAEYEIFSYFKVEYFRAFKIDG